MEAWLVTLQREIWEGLKGSMGATHGDVLNEESGVSIWSAGVKELAVLQKTPRPLQGSFSWNKRLWVGGVKPAMIQKTPASLKQSSLRGFPHVQHTEAVVWRGPRLKPVLRTEFGIVSSRWHRFWMHDAIMENGWGLVAGVATSKGADSIAVTSPVFLESGRGAEAWHHVAGSGSWRQFWWETG